jgi:hypothetical protein
MKNTFLMTTAMAVLVGTAGIASAQTPGGAQQNAPAASQSAPSAGQAAPAEKAAPMNRESDGMKGGQREDGNAQRAQDNPKGEMKSKGAETTGDQKGGKAASETTGDRSKDGMKADQKNAAEKDGMKNGQKNAAEGKSGTTTGQAGAGAKMSTEQRTTIRTSITKQNIKPATNINFSISVGTRVPRNIGFHALPAEVITIYPDWRGYEFFLVGSEIVVVNPRTLEIVAVLEA